MPSERRIIYRHIDEPGYTTDLACYQRSGGYEVLRKSVLRKPEELVQEVKDAGLKGRGGAGFPCGMKWGFLDRKSGKPVYLICNADESEPGSYKDRQIIYKDPHQLIEGVVCSAFAIQAKLAFIYIRGEMFEGFRILERAIEEARVANFVGNNILGSGYSVDIIVHRGAGCYICGEETGLIESLEGKRGYPRIKPPYFPAVLGLYNCPTIVNNVETLCQVKHVLDMGGKEFAKIGVPADSGTHIWGLSGHVMRPGYYEIEAGKATVRDLLYDFAGGPPPGRSFKALIPGGSSMKILRFGEKFKVKLPDGSAGEWGVLDIPLDGASFMQCGTAMGTGGMIVMDDSADMVEALSNLNSFYAHESCGQCTPCREGSLWLKRITTRVCNGGGRLEDIDLVKNVADQIAGRTICAHGEAVAWPCQSNVPKFRDEWEAKIRAQMQAREHADENAPAVRKGMRLV
ncbi:MAG TPA: NADH-quinone oxidoreductase subunit NuoF [Opitutales bacterium]|jgi:NADH-quinone oxidoreductase subunit F|nr:NADH-quinone oxidoreductase subunit NuoF [Opitutales bacterium]